ncbi:MAG: ChrR family anti-sigma-E factor [Pseudomonadota bacterium]
MTRDRNFPRLHPPEHVLLDYATGAAPASIVLIVACHLESCPQCQRDVALLEAVGGNYLETIEPVALSDEARTEILRLLDHAASRHASGHRPAQAGAGVLPAPLQHVIRHDLRELRWHSFDGQFEEAHLPAVSSDHRLSLLRATKGGRVPGHVHEGDEHLLVLQGSIQANGVQIRPGDYIFAEAGSSHEPTVDSEEDCLCLLVLAGPLRFESPEAAHLDAHFAFHRYQH